MHWSDLIWNAWIFEKMNHMVVVCLCIWYVMHHVMSCALVGVSDETIPEGIRCNIVCHVGPKAMIPIVPEWTNDENYGWTGTSCIESLCRFCALHNSWLIWLCVEKYEWYDWIVVHYEECYDMIDMPCVMCKLLSGMFGIWVVIWYGVVRILCMCIFMLIYIYLYAMIL